MSANVLAAVCHGSVSRVSLSATQHGSQSRGTRRLLLDSATRGTRVLAALLAVAVVAPVARAQCEADWDTSVGNSGLNSTVWSLHAVNDASAIGPALYAGGQFSSAGGTAAKNIAMWDGSSWSPLGTGAENGGVVYAMAAKDGVLYAGGAFGNMGGLAGTKRIAKWDGSTWSDVGGGMADNNAGIRAMVFWDDDLYVGGYLNEIGGVTAHKLAKWDGAAWSALTGDPLGSTDVVDALAVCDDGSGTALYVGGEFASAGGDAYAANVFRWDGTSVRPLGRGTNDHVEALVAWNGDLYVGGHFNRVYQTDGTEVVANKIARWDGTSWHALGTGLNSVSSYHVWALGVFDDGAGEALYAGGSFTTAGGVTVRNLALWDGAWHNVDSADLNGYVYALSTSTYDGGLYAGGTFTTSGTPSASRIVRWGGPLPVSPINVDADPNTITEGESSTLSASVAGATIYWYTDGCGQTLVGTGDVLVVNPAETTTYYAQAHDGTCWSYARDAVTVTVLCATPTITTQPIGGVFCTGHDHELCVTAEGSGELHYQWKRNGLALIGATASCYAASQAGTYSCTVSDDCGPTDSDTAQVAEASPDAGDFDGDSDTDFADFGQLTDCLEGPNSGVAAGCECVDVNTDGQIDVTDFAELQPLFTG